MCPCQALFTMFRVPNTYALAQKHSQDHGRRLNLICQPNTPRRLKPTCQPNTEHHDNKARGASERRQACDMDGLQCSRLKVPATTKIVPAGERPDPGASSHHRHDAGAPFGPAPCLKNNSWLWWVLAVRAAGSSCSISVSSKSVTLRCSWRQAFVVMLVFFPPLRRHAEPMRRFVVLRRRSSSALSRHTDSAKNCMACFRGCWIEMCCKKSSRVLAGPVPLVAWRPPAMVVPVVVTTVEIVPMKRTPSILLQTAGSIVCRICASCHVARPSVEGGLHQHGRNSLAEWE